MTMRIAVVAPRSVPYVLGGAERHWNSLVDGLRHAGHEAELVAVDAPERTLSEVLTSYRTFLHLDLSAFDVVISGKYPSWMVQHERHIRHLNHPLRGLYERYPASLAEPALSLIETVDDRLAKDGPDGLIDWALAQTDHALPGPFARAVVHALDRHGAAGVAANAAVSEQVARRAGYMPDGVSVAVIPPLTSLTSGPSTTAGKHFLVFGRLTPIKRTDLAIRAFGRAKLADYELRIAGTGPEETRLAELAARTQGVSMLGHISDNELATQIASAVAVVAVPEDEDFGLIVAEAQAAGRPVITTTDSGGVAEQVENGVNGLLVPPLAALIGRAMKQLANDSTLANRLGRAGRDQVALRSWAPMVRLVKQAAAPPGKPRALMLSSFQAEPVRSGGARRLRGVAAALQASHEVTILALTNAVHPDRVERRILDDGVVQTSVGRSVAHLLADSKMAALTGLAVDDIGCAVLHRSSPLWAKTLKHELATSDTVILAHPFLASSLPDRPRQRVVYDGHNVEADLKRELLRGRPGQQRLCQWVEEAEARAVQLAGVVTAMSDRDAKRFAELYDPALVVLAPNGVGDSLLVDATAAERSTARIELLSDLGLDVTDDRTVAIFVASNHPPNHKAADVLSDVALAHPELIIVLAGAHSERARLGVYNYGRFADGSHRRLLLAADVALNTVAEGSGTNLKLIEALAVGTPVVASTTGARGLENPNACVLIADDHAQLARAISNVRDDPATGARVSTGRQLAAAMAWSAAVGPLEAALQGP